MYGRYGWLPIVMVWQLLHVIETLTDSIRCVNRRQLVVLEWDHQLVVSEWDHQLLVSEWDQLNYTTLFNVSKASHSD